MPTFLTSGLGCGRCLSDVADLSGCLTEDYGLNFFTDFFGVRKPRQIPQKGSGIGHDFGVIFDHIFDGFFVQFRRVCRASF